MTTIDLYRKHKAGEVSREKFLYEVRRDNNLPFITNLTSYDDAVKMLKNKGIVSESNTKEAKADEAVKAEVKLKKQTRTTKELHIDQANPYEYRHGLQYELGANSDYSDESLAKAKAKVLKNLSKDANYYSTLLNQKQSHYEFKEPEVYAKGMQANADGTLKKGAGKLEKANVKDNLGKKEAGKAKPKGVKVMPDKGVTGAQKTIKEGVDDKVEDMIKSGKIKPEEVKNAAEKAMKGDSTSLVALMAGLKLAEDTVEEAKSKKINQYISVESDEDGDEYPLLNRLAISNYLKSVMDPEEVDSFMDDEEGFDESSSYFFEDEYVDVTEQEVEDWAKQEINYYLESESDEFPSEELEEAKAKKYVVFDKARGEKASKAFNTKEEAEAELKKINAEDPEHGDYVIDVMEGVQPKEDKHAKIKEALKKGLKELMNQTDIQNSKMTGKPVNVSKTNTQDITALQKAKANYTTYE